jgi:hypothetical protein
MGALRKWSNQAGQFRASFTTGLITTIASGGLLAAFRHTSAAYVSMIQRVKMRWITTTAFTVAQELQFGCYRASTYTADVSGGTVISVANPRLKKFSGLAASQVADFRVATTVALTVGTHTLDTIPMVNLMGWSQASATEPNSFETTAEATAGTTQLFAVQFSSVTSSEGWLIRNDVLMGAAGVGRLLVEVDWVEA